MMRSVAWILLLLAAAFLCGCHGTYATYGFGIGAPACGPVYYDHCGPPVYDAPYHHHHSHFSFGHCGW